MSQHFAEMFFNSFLNLFAPFCLRCLLSDVRLVKNEDRQQFLHMVAEIHCRVCEMVLLVCKINLFVKPFVVLLVLSKDNVLAVIASQGKEYVFFVSFPFF